MIITVYGKPITQGSKTRTRWGMRDDNGDTLKPWRDNVRSAALEVYNYSGNPFGGDPVNVNIYFTFARPINQFGTGKNADTIKASAPPFPSNHAIGDIDKLARACLDALTDAGIWKDDSQVVFLAARKVWVGDHSGLDRPGAVIHVTAALTGVDVPVGAACDAREVASWSDQNGHVSVDTLVMDLLTDLAIKEATIEELQQLGDRLRRKADLFSADLAERDATIERVRALAARWERGHGPMPSIAEDLRAALEPTS